MMSLTRTSDRVEAAFEGRLAALVPDDTIVEWDVIWETLVADTEDEVENEDDGTKPTQMWCENCQDWHPVVQTWATFSVSLMNPPDHPSEVYRVVRGQVIDANSSDEEIAEVAEGIWTEIQFAWHAADMADLDNLH